MLTERENQSPIQRAEESRLKIVKVIRHGETESVVVMKLQEAALALRIDQETFKQMGGRGQELGISVRENKVLVRVIGGQRTERVVYRQFYGFLQSLTQGRGKKYLENLNDHDLLRTAIPGLESYLEVVGKGNDLPDCELPQLQAILLARWQSLRDRTDLPPPEGVFEPNF